MSSQERVVQQLEEIDTELAEIDTQISILQDRREQLLENRDILLCTLEDAANLSAVATQEKLDTPAKDYTKESFQWSERLRQVAQDYFGITEFRPLQIPIMNATLDRQDSFVIMPTGGGKSLTYQIPAILDRGITLVISPLVSLIRDQVFHLKEARVPVAMLISSSTKEETEEAMQAMLGEKQAQTKKGKKVINHQNDAQWEGGSEQETKDIKLIYVTPEKIAKSKRFLAKLEQVYKMGRLSRIVIDECHCCSQFGHDFRPDYKKLNILRVVFPNSPIIALTATCPPTVLNNVIEILGLKPPGNGTLVFTSPLYRPNLIYKLINKPASTSEQISLIVSFIQSNYPRKSGIIYCLSKKDTQTIAEGITTGSGGSIKCSIYHADLDEVTKERVHRLWRENKVHVIVATIAFGLGINHLDVRFVLHHSISKSLEGYYQESGRAGRDGLPAECVLYYRGQDASRLSSLAVTETEGLKNVYMMLRYAQDIATCRKIIFEKYFSHKGTVVASISSDPSYNPLGPSSPCKKCDNCLRKENEVNIEDVTMEAFTILKLLKALKESEERVTLIKLIQMWKNNGKKSIAIEKLIQSKEVDIPVSKKFKDDDLERIINHLLIEGYLAEDFHFTAYSTISYLTTGRNAHRLLNKSRANIEQGMAGIKINLAFLTKNGAPSKRKHPKSIPAQSSTQAINKIEEFEFDLADFETIEEEEDDIPLKRRRRSERALEVITIDD